MTLEARMKTQMMQFRVNDEEKALIEKCAEKAGGSGSENLHPLLPERER
jgi:hypothetical protein